MPRRPQTTGEVANVGGANFAAAADDCRTLLHSPENFRHGREGGHPRQSAKD
jgi:hypothetical protein